MSKKEYIRTSLVIPDENKEILLHVSMLDSVARKNARKGGLIVWPRGEKGKHYHFYFDSQTGVRKAHIKDEKTEERKSVDTTLPELENSVASKELP